jgi:hypothetical protein
MGFEFKSDQPEQKLVDSKTTLSVNNNNLEWTDYSMGIADPDKQPDNLTQDIFEEGEEEKLAIQFIEENALYTKFMLWCGLQDQLKKLKDELAN